MLASASNAIVHRLQREGRAQGGRPGPGQRRRHPQLQRHLRGDQRRQGRAGRHAGAGDSRDGAGQGQVRQIFVISKLGPSAARMSRRARSYVTRRCGSAAAARRRVGSPRQWFRLPECARTAPDYPGATGRGQEARRAVVAPDHAPGQPRRCIRSSHRPPLERRLMIVTAHIHISPPALVMRSSTRFGRTQESVDRRRPTNSAKKLPVESRTTQLNGRWSGFRHLLKARLLELKREREVIFWAFGFPVFWQLDWALPSATSRLTLPR